MDRQPRQVGEKLLGTGRHEPPRTVGAGVNQERAEPFGADALQRGDRRTDVGLHSEPQPTARKLASSPAAHLRCTSTGFGAQEASQSVPGLRVREAMNSTVGATVAVPLGDCAGLQMPPGRLAGVAYERSRVALARPIRRRAWGP